MPNPNQQQPASEAADKKFAALFNHFASHPATSADLMLDKLDRIIELLEQQPKSTAILTGNVVREAMDELMRRNRR